MLLEKVLSFLRLGQILDLLGKKEEAVESYRQVLKLKDIEDSQGFAKKYLKKPYRGQPPRTMPHAGRPGAGRRDSSQ